MTQVPTQQEFNNPIETDAKGDPVPDQGSGDIGGQTAIDESTFAPDGSDDADFMQELGGYEGDPHPEYHGLEKHDAPEPTGYTPTEPDKTQPGQAKDPTEPQLEEPTMPGADEPQAAPEPEPAPQAASELDEGFAKAFGLQPTQNVQAAQDQMGQDFKTITAPIQTENPPVTGEAPVLPVPPPTQQPSQPPPPASAQAQAPAPAQAGSGESPQVITDQAAQQLVDEYGDAIKPAVDAIQTISKNLEERAKQLDSTAAWVQQQQVAEARQIVGKQLAPFEAGPLKDVYGQAGARTQAQEKAVADLTSTAAYYQQAKQAQGYPVTDEQAVQAAIWGQHGDVLRGQADVRAREKVEAQIEKRQRGMDVSGHPGAVGRKAAPRGSQDAFMGALSGYLAAN